MKTFKAIMWKEMIQIYGRKKSVAVNSACNLILIGMIGIIKLLGLRSSGTDTKDSIASIVVYLSIMCSYMALLALLRFWQEKSNKTIETLISMPIHTNMIVIAKTLVPVLGACMIGAIDTTIMTFVLWILYGKIYISYGYVLLIQLLFTIIVGMPYGIINAYSMWCMDLTYSKLVQSVSSFAYIAVLAYMYISKNTDPIALLKTILCCGIVMSVIATILLFKFNKEKIVLKFLD